MIDGTKPESTVVHIKEEISSDDDGQYNMIEIPSEILKKIKNSPGKIDPSPDLSANITRSKKKKKNCTKNDEKDEESKNLQDSSCSRDIIQSPQLFVICRRENQSSCRYSDIIINRRHVSELVEPQSSGEPRSVEVSPNKPESHAESEQKTRSGDRLSKMMKRKTRISFTADSESDSGRDCDVIENENPNHQSQVELNKSNLNENGKKLKSKVKRKNSWAISSVEFCSPVKKKHADHDNLELEQIVKSEKLSPSISDRDLKTEAKVLRKGKNREVKEKVEKRKGNTLLAMIHDSTSDSDSDNNEKKVDDSSEETLKEENLGKQRKCRVSNDEEKTHIPIAKHVHFKISDDYRSRSQKNDEKCPAENDEQSFEFREKIKSKKSSSAKAQSSESADISIRQVKTEPELFRKDRKHKAKDKVKKKKSNTLLAMIHDDASSSDSDENKLKVENIRSDTSSDEEKEDKYSNKKLAKNPSGKDRKFDLDEEAKDLEEMITALEAEEQVPNETVRKLHSIRVKFRHTVPPQHQVETCAGSRGPTQKQKDIMEKFGPIKTGKFTPEEDDIIVRNWKAFCKMHDWDSRNVQPFLYMRHQHVGFVAKFTERQKFVQFLADGLPWRTLYSVYWRFRTLYRPHLLSRYSEDEDRLIRAHMENSSAINTKNVRKFSELAKILNRTRASVWRRYQVLKRQRKPHKRTQWDLNLIKKIITNLMKLTLSDDVHQLKDLQIPLVVWRKISEKLKIDAETLKNFWLRKLHMELFCGEPVYMNDVKIKLIEYFYVKGITDSWEIEWSNVAKHFDGMTSHFLCALFHQLVNDKKFEGQEFPEILEQLYEVKRPELREARKDKCLPKIVFKKGTVKLIETSANDRPKRKKLIEDSSD